MTALRPLRFIGAVAAIASVPALLAVSAHAQTTTPETAPEASPSTTAPSSPATVPGTPGSETAPAEKMDKGVTETQPTPAPDSGITPSATQAPTAAPPATVGAEVTAPNGPEIKEVAIGSPVFGSDGKKLGEVKQVKAEANGVIAEIEVETGGFLGFGTKTIAVTGDKISKGGKNIELLVTSSDFDKLPERKDPST